MYRQENTKKWIQYEDGGQEPVAEHENINLKRHEPDREWFVVDRPKDFRPKSLAPEAFHPRHKGEEYMKSFMDPNQQKSSRTGLKVDGVPFGTSGGVSNPSKSRPDYTTFVDPRPQHSKRSTQIFPGTGVEFPENGPHMPPDGQSDEEPKLFGLTGHAAANLVTGVVRMLENGFDPNKKPAPEPRSPMDEKPAPGNGGTWPGGKLPWDTRVLYATDNHAAQQGKSDQARQRQTLPWGKSGSLLSDPARWLQEHDSHPASGGKPEQAEQPQKEDKGFWKKTGEAVSSMSNGIGQAVDKGMDAAGQATGKAWDAVRSKEVRDGVEFGARAAWEVTKDVGKIVGEDALVALFSSLGKVPYGVSIAADKLAKIRSSALNFDHEYKDTAERVAKRIQQQKHVVYGTQRKQPNEK
ncbi:MAG: hypothetical protein AB7E32_11145 [Desulfovibrio sp.]